MITIYRSYSAFFKAKLLPLLSFGALIVFFVSGVPQTAGAAMLFCNRTQTPIEAALGYRNDDVWISEGWWKIDPGQCSKVFGDALTQRFYFYYALALVRQQDQNPFIWSGKYQFCTDTKPFHIEGDSDCETKNYQTKGFQQVDVGANVRDYTLDFKDGSDEK